MYKYCIANNSGLIEEEVTDEEIIKNYDSYTSLFLSECTQGDVYVLDLSSGKFFSFSNSDKTLKDITPIQIEKYIDLPPYKIKREERAIILHDKLIYTGKTLGYEKTVGSTIVTISLVCWDNPLKENEFEIDLRKNKWPMESTYQK
jgi:hypothetical protein